MSTTSLLPSGGRGEWRRRSAYAQSTFVLLGLCSLALLTSVRGEKNSLAPVRKEVGARTGSALRWARDAAARAQVQREVHALLQRPLTVSRAVQIALLNNRDLQASFEKIGLSEADLREARTLANPSADLAVKFPDRAPEAPLYEWGVAQNFLQLLLIPLRTRVAREHLAATQLRVADDVLQLVSEVKVAFYQAQAAEALLTRWQALQGGQAASLELMQKLHEAGNVPDLSLLREQAAYSQARLELVRVEAEGRTPRETINRLLGLWGSDTRWKLAGTLPDVPPQEPATEGLEALAVAQRLDLAAARQELESTARALGLEKAFRWIGALDFGLAGESEPEGTHLLGPTVRLELPLFQQGQARLARGEAALRQAERRFEQLAIGLRAEVRTQRDRLLSQRDIARFYHDDLLPTRRQITAQTLAQYNAMLVGAFDTFRARQEEMEAERGLIEATRAYWIARAELERTVGGSLEPPARPPAPHPQPSKPHRP